MGPGTRVRLAVVVTGVIAASTFVLAGPAVAKKHGAKRSYTSSGQGTYESTGQACFGAKWAGTGGWATSYAETDTVPNQGIHTDTIHGHSSYSWDESEVAGGAACALELLKVPGDKPSGGAAWNKGYARTGSSGSEVQTFPTSPTVMTPCSMSKTAPPSGSGTSVGGDMSVTSKGSSLVFTIDLGLPEENCDYGFPGDALPGGKVGDFLESTSAKVPRSVFEHARKVAIAISSDPKAGPTPNCGLAPVPSPGSTVKCSQTGHWQGTLTLYEG